MSSTAFREAFRRAEAFAQDKRAEEKTLHIAAMSDVAIIDAITADRLTVKDIDRQLLDDQEDKSSEKDGGEWRGRAKKARRAVLSRIDALEAEAVKRGLLAVIMTSASPDVLARKADAELRRIAFEHEQAAIAQRKRTEADERIRLKQELARVEAEKRRQKTEEIERRRSEDVERCQLFVKAAYRIHSKDSCARIWRRAMQMFPDSPAWKDINVREIMGSDS